jgi:hypothetical protein
VSFSVGAPVSEAVVLAGRHRQLSTIADRLCSSRDCTSIIGERKTGKTSVLYALRSRRVRREYGLDQADLILAYIDSQMFSSNISPKQFWKLAARQIALESDLADIGVSLPADMPRSTYSMYEFLGHLARANRTAVLLVDEFDHMVGSAELNADFFAGLHSLISTGRLCMVTASVNSLPALLQDREGPGSPLWNMIMPVSLPLFNAQDCQDCLAVCTEGMDYGFTPDEILELTRISGGHPFLLQLVGEGLYQAYSHGLGDQERLDYAQEHSRAPVEQMFRLYWDKSSEEQKIILASFALLEAARGTERSFDETEIRKFYNAPRSVFWELGSRSLLRRSAAGKYELMCPALASWIAAELTASKNESIDYESWLASDHSTATKLSTAAKKELRAILPRIASNYRELVIAWVSNPENLIHVATLLRSALGV